MADYPEWVLKHKVKGTYINKVGDKYYLYAAHSERIKGTNKVRRISDGYLGRITENDGLIPPKNKISSSPCSYELGNSFLILYFTNEIIEGMCRSFRKNGRLLYVCSVLNCIYGFYSIDFFQNSYLHFIFQDIIFPSSFPANQQTAIERGTRMIQDKLSTKFGTDMALVLAAFSDIRLIEITGAFYCSKLSSQVLTLSKKYNISWENELWQK